MWHCKIYLYSLYTAYQTSSMFLFLLFRTVPCPLMNYRRIYLFELWPISQCDIVISITSELYPIAIFQTFGLLLSVAVDFVVSVAVFQRMWRVSRAFSILVAFYRASLVYDPDVDRNTTCKVALWTCPIEPHPS